MTTLDKLEKYEGALKDWQFKVKAASTNPYNRFKQPEPDPSVYHLTTSNEVWAASKVRAKLIIPPRT